MEFSTISTNTALEWGGGVYIEGSAITGTMESCDITANTADKGGGFYIKGSGTTVTMEYCTISENTAIVSGGSGGGLNILSATVTMESCTISSNSVAYENGNGGGLYIGSSATVTIESCSLFENTAKLRQWFTNSGGGFFIDSATVTMESCTISSNTASHGGGFYINGSTTVTMESCNITDNTANWSGGDDANGGGIYIEGSATTLIMRSCAVSSNSASNNGGGFYINSATVTLVGCTFFSNSASRDAADVYHIADWSGVDLNLNFYSLCPGDSFNAGTGSLDCDRGLFNYYYGSSCDEPKDLSGTSSCIACPFYAPFSCCGATACSASASICTATELEICGNPTPMPTLLPTLPPTNTLSPTHTFVPTNTPSHLPTQVPTQTLVPTLSNIASDEAELNSALVNDAIYEVEFSNDIALTATIAISGLTGVRINGKGFKVDGQGRVRCFLIENGAEVSFVNLIITNGKKVSFGQQFFHCFPFDLLGRSVNNTAPTLFCLSRHSAPPKTKSPIINMSLPHSTPDFPPFLYYFICLTHNYYSPS